MARRRHRLDSQQKLTVVFYRPLTFLAHRYVNLLHLPILLLLDHYIRDVEKGPTTTCDSTQIEGSKSCKPDCLIAFLNTADRPYQQTLSHS